MPTAMEMNQALLDEAGEPRAEATRPKPARTYRRGECGVCNRPVVLTESNGKFVIELHAPRIAGKTPWRTCPTSGREVS